MMPDLKPGDRVRNVALREDGTVEEATISEVVVLFDGVPPHRPWRAIYDVLWFNLHRNRLIKLEERATVGINNGQHDDGRAMEIGLKLIPVVQHMNMLFNGATDPEQPEWGCMVVVWPMDGSEKGRMLTNKVSVEMIRHNITRQIETLQAALQGLEKNAQG